MMKLIRQELATDDWERLFIGKEISSNWETFKGKIYLLDQPKLFEIFCNANWSCSPLVYLVQWQEFFCEHSNQFHLWVKQFS